MFEGESSSSSWEGRAADGATEETSRWNMGAAETQGHLFSAGICLKFPTTEIFSTVRALEGEGFSRF